MFSMLARTVCERNKWDHSGLAGMSIRKSPALQGTVLTPLLHYKIPFLSSIIPLNTKRRLLYLKPKFVPHSKPFSSRLQNQSVYAVSGTSRCLFSDKYKTHKNSVGRTYSS